MRNRGTRTTFRGPVGEGGSVSYSVTDLDSYFDYAWLPQNALDSGSATVSDGDVVDTLVDHLGSLTDLPYTGATGQRTGYSGPIYKDDGGNNKYIDIQNLNDIRWDYTGSLSPTIAQPITMLVVFRRMISAPGESLIKGGGFFNIKDNGTNPPTRYDFDLNTATSGRTSTWGGIGQINTCLIQFDSGAEEFILNGTDIYSTGTIVDSDWNDITIGASTNLMGAQLFGVWIKASSNFSSGDKSAIDTLLGNIWTDRGTIPSAYADLENLTVERDGSGATIRFYLSTDGGTTDWTGPGGTTYQWQEAGTGSSRSFTSQNDISGATSADMDRADYTGVFTSHPSPSNVWTTCNITIPGIGSIVVPEHLRDNV